MYLCSFLVILGTLLKLCYIFMEVRTASTIQEVAATPMSYASIIIFLFVLYDLHNNSELFLAVFLSFATH